MCTQITFQLNTNTFDLVLISCAWCANLVHSHLKFFLFLKKTFVAAVLARSCSSAAIRGGTDPSLNPKSATRPVQAMKKDK